MEASRLRELAQKNSRFQVFRPKCSIYLHATEIPTTHDSNQNMGQLRCSTTIKKKKKEQQSLLRCTQRTASTFQRVPRITGRIHPLLSPTGVLNKFSSCTGNRDSCTKRKRGETAKTHRWHQHQQQRVCASATTLIIG